MSAEGVPDPAERLEAALERIRLAAQAREAAPAPSYAALPQAAPRVTTPDEAKPGADILSRLDALIADLRTVLGTQA